MVVSSDEQAATALLAGGVGVLPTDTVYGIVARAADKKAVARLYALKDREHKPGTVIAATVQQLIELGIEERYVRMVEQWWPGSLSIETPLGPELAYLHQDTGRQGFRVVSDERVRKVLEQTGPLLTSSANLPGAKPADTLQEAVAYFNDDVDFYVDGGDRSGRQPSTLARVTDRGIEIIRQGAVVIPADALVSPGDASANCPFCLRNNLFKGPILFQNDYVFATTALGNEGSYLIIPKQHVEKLSDLSDMWWTDFKAALQALPSLPASYNLSLNYGEAAGRSVPHIHFWIIPRDPSSSSAGKGLVGLIAMVDELKSKE